MAAVTWSGSFRKKPAFISQSSLQKNNDVRSQFQLIELVPSGKRLSPSGMTKRGVLCPKSRGRNLGEPGRFPLLGCFSVRSLIYWKLRKSRSRQVILPAPYFKKRRRRTRGRTLRGVADRGHPTRLHHPMHRRIPPPPDRFCGPNQP